MLEKTFGSWAISSKCEGTDQCVSMSYCFVWAKSVVHFWQLRTILSECHRIVCILPEFSAPFHLCHSPSIKAWLVFETFTAHLSSPHHTGYRESMRYYLLHNRIKRSSPTISYLNCSIFLVLRHFPKKLHHLLLEL